MGECEFFLISEMNSQLIVHQPYRTLTALQDTFNLHPDEVSMAWSIINDHYMTDLPLLYPPHIIALTAILLAMISRQHPNNTSQSAQASETASAAPRLASMPLALAAAQQSFAQIRAIGLSNIHTGNGSGGPSTPTLTSQNSGGLSSQSDGVTETGKKPPDPRLIKIQRLAMWLSESNIDIEAMVDCTQELLSFYEVYDAYNDKHTKEQITRFIKARGL